MSHRFSQITCRLMTGLPLLLASLVIPAGVLQAADNRIAPDLETVTVTHAGKTVVIQRGHDPAATLPAMFQKTERGCPPFCVQPMTAIPGVETIGELEVLAFLQRMAQGDTSLLLVDSRTPDWVLRGTIPGAVNIPWNRISRDRAGTFETPAETEEFQRILTDQFGARRDPVSGAWDFSAARTLLLFCNGIWCAQSTENLHTLAQLGYPVHKLKWYRGGMQDWVSVGLTTVTP